MRKTINEILDALAIETPLRVDAEKRLAAMAPEVVDAMHGRAVRLREHSHRLRQRVAQVKEQSAAAKPRKGYQTNPGRALRRMRRMVERLLAEVFGSDRGTTPVGAKELAEIGRGHEKLKPQIVPYPLLLNQEVINGLAKIEFLAREWRPDYIVAPDAGGMIVGQYLAKRLRMKANRVVKMPSLGRDARNTLFGSEAKEARELRILVVGDIATNWSPLKRIHKVFSGTHVQSACLVAAGNAATTAFAYAPLIADTPTVDLPWASDGSLNVKPDAYLLGADPKQVRISKAAAEQAVYNLR